MKKVAGFHSLVLAGLVAALSLEDFRSSFGIKLNQKEGWATLCVEYPRNDGWPSGNPVSLRTMRVVGYMRRIMDAQKSHRSLEVE